MAYDAFGRRIVKDIDNCADWDATYHTYYNGWRRVELRDGSDQVLKQWVWGLPYVDEPIRTDLNQDPIDTTEQICERSFWTAQDANFNVLGVFTRGGGLVERYEYTPYGRRTVYSHGWSPADLDEDGDVDQTDEAIIKFTLGGGMGTDHQERLADYDGNGSFDYFTDSGYFSFLADSALDHGNDDLVTHPVLASARFTTLSLGQSVTPLCDIGHQGLSLDREFGGVYDIRTRIYLARLGRFGQRDKAGYVDGLSMYQYLVSDPIMFNDSYGYDPFSDLQRQMRWSGGSGLYFGDEPPKYTPPSFKDRVSQELEKTIAEKHKYTYYEATGIGDFYSKISSYIRHLDVNPTTGAGKYNPTGKRVYIPTELHSIEHEMIHALDHANGWYIRTALTGDRNLDRTGLADHIGGNIERAERLAYAGDFMIKTAHGLALMDICSNCELAQQAWDTFWTKSVENTFDQEAEWGTLLLKDRGKLRPNDVIDAKSRLGIELSCKKLKPIFEEMLYERGVFVEGGVKPQLNNGYGEQYPDGLPGPMPCCLRCDRSIPLAFK